jgi:tRNA dimethylallyltransferase|tara:strand:- start:288 stop:1190 length:903 start_codon:yes stop_codon:yes gene_type:complete
MKINKKYLIVLVGPTASGKTKLSLDIANIYNSEIISADSRQFYKELEIGTAKPSSLELSTAKHHFINNLSIHDDYSVGSYRVEVNSILNNYYKKNQYAILVGGSGLFINVICNGIDEIPKVSIDCRNEIRDYYKSNGIASLRKLLKKYDIKHYQTIDLNNPQRLMRALEVCIYTKNPFSSFLKKNKKKNIFNTIKIGLRPSKDVLYNNINMRVDKMIEDGLIEEALRLYSFRDLNSLQTVGYKELFEFFDNKISKEEAIELIKRNTRRYAKRQMTWFKRDSEIKWFDKIDDSIFQFLKKY